MRRTPIGLAVIALGGLTSLSCSNRTLDVGGPTGGGGAVDASRSAVASIRVSVSTNSGQIDVAVYDDGSAERTVGPPRNTSGAGFTPPPKSYPARSPNVMTFLTDLAAVGDASRIPTANICVKSVSSGTETTVTTADGTSGDLQCLSNAAPAAAIALAHDCDVLTARR